MIRVLLITIVCTVVSCSQKALSVGEGSDKNLILKIKDKATVGTLSLTLTEVRDSRCPASGNCIRAGEAIAVLNVVDNNKSERNVQLCTGVDCTFMGLSETYLLSGEGQKYLFKLDSITPYPGTTLTDNDTKVYVTMSVLKQK